MYHINEDDCIVINKTFQKETVKKISDVTSIIITASEEGACERVIEEDESE